MLGVGPAEGVELALLRDELAREQPVHLVPRGGDLGGDGVAEDVADGPHEVVADDGVLVGLDAQRHVLVRDALHDRREVGGGRVDQVDGVGDDRRGQRLGLLTDGLVGLVEHPHQLGVRLEHVRVEPLGDLLGVLGDDAGRGLDGLGGLR